MKIGIDARIAYYNRSGIFRYLHGLLPALESMETGHEIILYQSWKDRRPLSPGFQRRSLFTPSHFSLEGPLLAWELRRSRLDLLHCLDFFVPRIGGLPLVLSVYDLFFLKDKTSVDASSARHYRKLLQVLPYAAQVICTSESTRRDLEQLAAVPAGRIQMVYPGIEERFFDRDLNRQSEAKQKYNLPEKYILVVGTIEPRKNHTRLFEAYARVLSRLGAKLPPLLLVGRRGYRAESILAPLAGLELRDKIHYLGEVPDNDLVPLYQQASLVAYVSLYEGFGFPLLEAMASAVPVLTSRGSCLEEVAQDAAHYVDPLDTDSIASGLERLVSDETTAQELVHNGRERIKAFSWRRAAEQILQAYEQAGAAA